MLEAQSDVSRAAEPSRCVLAVRGVTKRFGTHLAVAGVDLEIGAGEFVSILGPSGCGKTTLLNMVAGLVAPDAGEIWVGERKVAGPDLNLPPEKRSLGMVFQDYALWPHMTVREQVSFPLRMRRQSPTETAARVERLLEQVDLQELANRRPAELSGGQQQRVGLARALASSPLALLLDEPLSNLDAQLRDQMREEIRGVCTQLDVACLYVTHDQTEALALSDRIAVMSGGRILQDGAPSEVFNRPSSERVAVIVGAGEIVAGHAIAAGFQPECIDAIWRAGRHPQLADGDRAAMVVPSSRITVAGEPAFANAVPAVVERNVFLGDRWQLQCRLESGQVLRAGSVSAWPVGESVWCSFSPEHGYITKIEEPNA